MNRMLLFVLLLALMGGLKFHTVLAQDATPTATSSGETTISGEGQTSENDQFIFQINGQAVVPAGQTTQNAVVVSSDLIVDGTVEDSVFAVDSNVTINGTVGDNLTVFGGTLTLGPGAVVGDVNSAETDITRADGAQVTGEFNDEDVTGALTGALAAMSILFWFGTLLLALLVAALFAWLGRDQLYGAAETIKHNLPMSIVTALVLFIGLPILAVLVFFTIVGIPISLATLMVVLPMLGLLGEVVFGTLLGSFILKPAEHGWSNSRTFGSALLGTLLMHLGYLVPVLGFVVLLASLLGAGALVLRIVKNASSDQTPASLPAGAD